MIDDRMPGAAGRPSFAVKIGSWLLVIPSVAVGIIAVELLCQAFFSSWYTNNVTESQRVIFLDGPAPIFQNHEDIFTYVTDAEVRNLTIFYRDESFNVEYDYRFRTNNLGLVQDADVVPDRDSLLLLGDSLTEGQGAKPWFPQVAPEIARLGYQAVNGGLLGTGFEQWNKLRHYLAAKNVRIRKIVVLFISDDYRRAVWQPTPAVLQCLSTPTLCRVLESYYYRLPPPDELSSWIAKIRTARTPKWPKSWLAARAEALLPASYHVYGYLKEKLYEQRHEDPAKIARFDQAQQQSRTAIGELISAYGPDNVMFLHIPQRDEVGRDPIDLGLKARRSITEAGGKLFDGFKLCGLATQDYYRNDGHPNPAGYAKIAACVTQVLKHM